MLTDFNKIYSLEIDIKNIQTTYDSKALYANTDLNTSVMLIKLSLDGKGLDVTDKTVTAYIRTGIDGKVTMQKCEILEATEGIVGLDFKNSALKVGTNIFFIEIKSENNEIINTPLINYKVVELFDVLEGVEGENEDGILTQIISDIEVVKTSVGELETEIATLKKSIEEIMEQGVGNGNVFIGSVEDAPENADIVIDNSDEGLSFNDIVTVPIIDSTLTLTKNKLQATTIEDNTTIILPTVDKHTEIHLFFDTTSELTLILPSIKWQGDITIEANKTYEFIFTYKNEWLGGALSYE